MKATDIIVTQHRNHNYGAAREDGTREPEYLYEVEKTVNTLVENLGTMINKDRINDLISIGINVTVLRPKQ